MFGGSSVPAFGQSGAFGQETNSTNGNSFGPGSINATASTGIPFGATMSSGNSTAFGLSGNSNPFGSGSMFMQNSNINLGNPFVREGSFSFPSPVSASTGSGMFTGNSAGVFGGNSGFGTPAFAPSTGSSFSAFGTTSSLSSGDFGHSLGSGALTSGANKSFGSTQSTFSSFPAPVASERSIFGHPISASESVTGIGASTTGLHGSTFGSLSRLSGPSTVSSMHRGSRVASYVATRDESIPGADAGNIVSISAMPIYQSKNHEELRFEDYQLSFDKAFGSSFGSGVNKSVGSTQSTFTSTLAPVDSRKSIFDHPRSASISVTTGPHGSTFGSFSRPSTISSTHRGSRVASYVATRDESIPGADAGNIVSISAMPAYQNKNHEELRFEDYQPSFDKALPSISPVGPAFVTTNNKQQTSSAVSTGPGSWGNFSSTMPSFPASPPSRATSTGSGSWGNFSSTIPAFPSSKMPSATSTGPGSWGAFPSKMPSATSTGPGSWGAFPSSKMPSATSTGPGSWGNFPSSTPSMFNFQSQPQEPSAASIETGHWAQFPSNTPPSFTFKGQLQTSSPLLTGPGSQGELPSSTTSQIHTSTPAAFTWTEPERSTDPQKTQNVPEANKIFEQSPAGTLRSETHNQSTGMQQYGQSHISITLSAAASPFGVQSTFQTSVDPLIPPTTLQHGISSIPISEKRAPFRRVSTLSARNLTLGRSRISFEKYKPKNDGQKVPFYEEDLLGIHKAAASVIPRQNPKAWVLNPLGKEALETKSSYSFLLEDESSDVETGECNSLLEEKMPKMQSLDYYINPPIQELAAKERVEPGFCCHVKDFVVGRKGYGSIKFLGETDVRNLDIESLIKFNNREVTVYMDESRKPQVGEGLNKPAEVTLLNIKCIAKDTGEQYVDGPKVEKFRKMLMKKAAEQGAEFVCYDPVEGEWKFRVQHF